VRKNIRKEETTNSDSLKEQVYIVDTSPQASKLLRYQGEMGGEDEIRA
jgi:hypothetical protein